MSGKKDALAPKCSLGAFCGIQTSFDSKYKSKAVTV